MKYSFVGVIIWGIVLLIGLAVIAGFITLLFFGIQKKSEEKKQQLKIVLGKLLSNIEKNVK